MALRTAQLGDLLIHHLHKVGDGPRRVLRQGVGRLVGGLQQHSVEAVLHGEAVPRHAAQLVAAVGLHAVHRRLGKLHRLVQLAVLQHHQGRQELGDAGRRVGQVNILSKQNRSGIHIHHDPRLRLDACISGPVRFPVGRQHKELTGQQETDERPQPPSQ